MSRDPICIAHAEHLLFPKHPTLSLDRVGWHKIADGTVGPDEVYDDEDLDRMKKYYSKHGKTLALRKKRQ